MRTIACLGLVLLILAAQPAAAATFEDEVMAELNRVRTDPAALVRDLLRDDAGYDGRDNGYGLYGDEYAVEEAIDFLSRQPPLPPLDSDKRLAAAASDHVRAQGLTGEIGHGAPGGLGRRMQARGVWAGMSGETISYGQATPHEVVRQLVIDFGVADRGHRQAVFSRGYQAAGVACGRHADYGRMCVIDFAGAFPR